MSGLRKRMDVARRAFKKKGKRRMLRVRRVTYPYTSLVRRRRFRRRKANVGYRLYKAVHRHWNTPILVRFFTSREVKVSGNDMANTFNINLNGFNNDSVSQQLYGYVELFDQFKIVAQVMDMHFRTSAEFTDLDTSIPHVFWVYDVDLKRQSIDLFNMMKLQNMRHKLLPPLKHLRLTLRPRWTERRLVLNRKEGDVLLDTHTGVKRMDNPWMDTDVIKMSSGQAPDFPSSNGYAIAIKNANKRVLVIHNELYVMFRGRKNNQSYVTETPASDMPIPPPPPIQSASLSIT